MKFVDYQLLAKRTEKNSEGTKEYRLQHALLGISSESGELADAIKKYVIYERELDITNLLEEVGDVLWYLAIVANVCETSLEDIAMSNINKLRKRYPEKYSDVLSLERRDKAPGEYEGGGILKGDNVETRISNDSK